MKQVLRRDAFERLCGNLFEILRRDISKYTDYELPEQLAPEAEDDEVLY